MRKFSELLLKYRVFILVAITAITVLFMIHTPRIKINDNFEELGLKTDPDYDKVQYFLNEFGHDKLVIVAFQCDDVLLNKNLQIIRRLENKFRKLEYVENVLCLTNAPDICNIGETLEITKLINEFPKTKYQRESLRKRIKDNPFYINNIVSSDFMTSAINLKFKDDIVNDKIRRITIQNLREIISEERLNDVNFFLTGIPVLEEALVRFALRDIIVCAPIALILFIIAMFFIFRDYFSTIFPLISVGLSVIWTFGIISFLSGELNLITVLVPTMILVIGTSDCVHIITNFKNNVYKRNSIKEINYITLDNIVIPCMLTSLTTMIGFFSMNLNQIIPLKEFGIYSGVGIGIAFTLTIILIPILFSFTNINNFLIKKKKGIDLVKYFSIIILKNTIKYKYLVVFLSLIIIIISIQGARNLEIDTRPYNYFGNKSKIYKSEKVIRQSLSGTVSLYIFVSGKKENSDIINLDVLRRIETIKKYLIKQKEVGKVISITDLIKYMNLKLNNDDKKHYNLPENIGEIKELLFFAEMYDRNNIIGNFIDTDYKNTYIIIRSSKDCSDIDEIRLLTKKIKNYLDKININDFNFELLGTSMLMANAVEPILKGLRNSLIIASIIIFFIMTILFRSFKIGIISMIPNLIPILLTLGFMGILGIKLNFVTSAFAGVSLGLAVDDTIHFLARYKKEMRKDGDHVKAMFRTFEVTGKAIIFTSIIFAAGFCIFLFSGFKVTQNFGILVGFTVISALFGDLILLPSLLLLLKPFKKEQRRIK